MTNIQAIDLLKGLEQSLDDYCELNDEGKTAFRMAITALEVFGISEQLPSAQPDVLDTNVGDMISRQAAIDAMINSRSNADVTLVPGSYTNGWRDGRKLLLDELLQVVFELTSAQSESRTFVELVVEYPDPELCVYKEYKGKPYYSILYIENGETYEGYGTYSPEVLSQYLREYFISSAQPEIIRCRDCKYYKAYEDTGRLACHYVIGGTVVRNLDDFCSRAERRTDD